MRTGTEGQLIERAAFAAVGAVIGTLLGVAFELVRIFFAGSGDFSPASLAVCGALGALVGVFAPQAIFIGITACASFFVDVMSALTPEYWFVRGRSPFDWPRWVVWSFALGALLVIAIVLLG